MGIVGGGRGGGGGKEGGKEGGNEGGNEGGKLQSTGLSTNEESSYGNELPF